METEKPLRKVVSALCTLEPSRVSGVAQSKSKGLQARGSSGANPSPLAGADRARCREV